MLESNRALFAYPVSGVSPHCVFTPCRLDNGSRVAGKCM